MTYRIITVNLIVFVLWLYLGAEPSGVMVNNFLVSWESLAAGRFWTLLGSVFSHVGLAHLFINMLVLSNFGPPMEYTLGRWRFLRFYLAAGLLASLTHSVVSAFVLGAPELPALGASGAISGVVLLFSLIYPREKLLFFGIIPVPALFGAFLFIGLDLWGLIRQAGGAELPIGYGAHLGGALAGFVYYWTPKIRTLRQA